MSNVAIRVDGLSKWYRIGKRERYKALRDTLTDALYAPARRLAAAVTARGPSAEGEQSGSDSIWALKDISFEVKRGEVVGIIGRNGAGKSTLLKILSRITGPTDGYAEIHGRVGSLLEVGTGFHPELTGRENIYLNGAMLGMRKAEIDRRFDEIVAFAEVEKFLDTPVKRYSSGMYVRLAFAVAAHLEPEVLVVDEVLAVGDAAFQKKCLGKMADVAQGGRTILFVSHNMAAVEGLCRRAIVLDRGGVSADGASEVVIRGYLRQTGAIQPVVDLRSRPQQRSIPPVRFTGLRVLDRLNKPCSVFPIGETVRLEFEVTATEPIGDPHMGIGVSNSLGLRVFTVSTRFQNARLGPLRGGVVVHCQLPDLALAPDQYFLKATIGDSMVDLDVVEGVPAFEVSPEDYFGSGRLPSGSQGIIVQAADWSAEAVIEARPRSEV